MAELEIIEQLLNINTDGKRLRDGKRKKYKNKYYYYTNQFYIISLTRNKWMVCSDDDNTRRLLRRHTWFFHSGGYAMTSIGRSKKYWHQVYMTYEKPIVADHINNKIYDNRAENLRLVQQKENMRNLTKSKANTSGKQGVSKFVRGGCDYWRAYICSDDGTRIMKYYSIAKYGDDEAKQLAINQRLEWQKKYNYIGD